MKRMKQLSLILLVIFVLPFPVLGRELSPIVPTDWLSAHSAEVVILDIRSPGDYAAGHIPGSINEPFATAFDPTCRGPSSHWIIGSKDCLWLQLPEAGDLFKTIGNLGIKMDSRVVVVTAPNANEPPYFGLANATRVADTLIYAGIKNVAILDGGYPRWAAEGRPASKDPATATPAPYQAKVKKEIFVSIEYVRKHVGKAVIVDARDAEVYFGMAMEPFAPREGHIPTARSLPTPWMWKLNPDGTYVYRDKETLKAMASGVIGQDKANGIIVYCGVGGYASSWWFVLTQVLGYQNVRIFDGSIQEWSKDPKAPMTKYSWR
ncbi:MAG: Thiosulfate sulfurtransferase [Deltaproteobacteria bacterium]|jgi:thiosulfate/3-mercaptopyruvate sulfurtransferase|nr:Thiosulfate sulfurtransferase [Deltaproteobacteria bacterium]